MSVATQFVQDGDILNVIAPANVVAGDLFFRGTMCFQYTSSVLAGQWSALVARALFA